uniref:Uncharacterized protein n=1 Tax=Anguilla anguilla TaxID=7936 RepID=A0A0E9U4I7_ANGAN
MYLDFRGTIVEAFP